jgi:DNA-binding NarL/FixJ family response regulator
MFKILIIDSNVLFRTSLGKSLCAWFKTVEIEEAGSAAEGLEKVDSFSPQLIFIDINLPDKNGLDLAKMIQASHSEIILAILTSYDFPEYRAAANDSGIKHLIPKNDWTSRDILQMVEAVLHQRPVR